MRNFLWEQYQSEKGQPITMKIDVLVIGGGPAGMMAAHTAACRGKRVMLIEPQPMLGRKLLITGKGRCNITNNCDVKELIEKISNNGRFLYGAFSRFGAQDTMHYFESSGLSLKVERGNRVFPQSDRAVDVRNVLKKNLVDAGVVLQKRRVIKLLFASACGSTVATSAQDNLEISVLSQQTSPQQAHPGTAQNTVVGVLCEGGVRILANAVIIATGGKSYPLTGSTGDGYLLATQAGHRIVLPRPSLVPLIIREVWCGRVAGLSLKNIQLSLYDRHTGQGKLLFSQRGELLFTHFGVSGPLSLRASADLFVYPLPPARFYLLLDLKPALSAQQLDQRLLRDFQEAPNRDLGNSLGKLFPKSLIPELVKLSGIPAHQKTHTLSKVSRQSFVKQIKNLPLTIQDVRPLEEAIITAGGVCVSQISPKTMGSKCVSGLYFCGEVLDVDAYTGGYNLQIAFSTGYIAGMSC